jgi:hypothetical protein
VLLKDPGLVGPEARRYAHLPPGHQEAWSDAFRNVIADVYARIAGRVDPEQPPAFPTFVDGYVAACLVDAILDSHRRGGVWTTVHTKSEVATT